MSDKKVDLNASLNQSLASAKYVESKHNKDDPILKRLVELYNKPAGLTQSICESKLGSGRSI